MALLSQVASHAVFVIYLDLLYQFILTVIYFSKFDKSGNFTVKACVYKHWGLVEALIFIPIASSKALQLICIGEKG